MIYCYTLAPTVSPPESLASRFPHATTYDDWFRYGSYCKSTVPSHILTVDNDGTIIFDDDLDLSSVIVHTLDPDSDTSISLQALSIISKYFFTEKPEKPIVISKEIGELLYKHPSQRLIDFTYEDDDLKVNDYLEMFGTTLDPSDITKESIAIAMKAMFREE